MTILSKAYKPDNFESHISLKLSFRNIRHLRLNFADCESFLESNSPDILALCETNLDDSIDYGDFSVRLSSFNPKGFQYSYAWSHSLCERRTSFCTRLTSRKLCRFLLMFSTGFASLFYFFFLYRSPFSSLCTVFDSISSNIDGQIAIFWPSKNFKNLIKFLFPFKFKLLFPGIGLFKLHKCKVSQHDLHFEQQQALIMRHNVSTSILLQ